MPRISCLCLEKLGKGQSPKEKGVWGLFSTQGFCVSVTALNSGKAGKPAPFTDLIDRLVSICTTNCYTTCGDDKYFILCRICVLTKLLVTVTGVLLLCLCLFAEFMQIVAAHLNRLDRKFFFLFGFSHAEEYRVWEQFYVRNKEMQRYCNSLIFVVGVVSLTPPQPCICSSSTSLCPW